MWSIISYFLTFCSGVIVTVIGGLVVIWVDKKLYRDAERNVVEEITKEKLYAIKQELAQFESGLVRLEAVLGDFRVAAKAAVDDVKKEVEALKAGQLRLYRMLHLSPEEEIMTCRIEDEEQGNTGLLKGG